MHLNTTVTPNAGQQAASDGFFQFLLGGEREMAITGPGGVGKTWLMGHLIDSILPQYYDTCKLMDMPAEFDTVNMTATTNKAADVLSLSTNRPVDTIHSYLNLKVQDDYKTGRSVLTKGRNWQVRSRQIVFIDEFSTIDTPLINAVDEGLSKSKIIYVGDHCQMAPVMEAISPVVKRNMPIYELTEPVRNADQPALMALCTQLRQTVETGEFKPIKLVPGVIEHLDDSMLQQKLHDYFTEQTHSARILAYTNHRVVQYNDHIRTLRKLPDEYTVGEYLVNNSAIRLKGSANMLSVEEEVEVMALADRTIQYPISGRTDVSLEVREATLKTRLGGMFSEVPVPVDRQHYLDLVNYFRKDKKWQEYFFLKNNFPDLRQRDAGTVYKAQGSTYDTVFIDVGNISTCHQPQAVARMLYVAVSRPRTKIYFYGKLADKYGGIIA